MLVRDIVTGSEQAVDCKIVFDSVGSRKGAVRWPWRSDRSRLRLQSLETRT